MFWGKDLHKGVKLTPSEVGAVEDKQHVLARCPTYRESRE